MGARSHSGNQQSYFSHIFRIIGSFCTKHNKKGTQIQITANYFQYINKRICNANYNNACALLFNQYMHRDAYRFFFSVFIKYVEKYACRKKSEQRNNMGKQ